VGAGGQPLRTRRPAGKFVARKIMKRMNATGFIRNKALRLKVVATVQRKR
jgi:hypothetical protein